MFTPAQFAARARGLKGVPYVLGASTARLAPGARPKALDCSETVELLCRENGTPNPGTADTQFAVRAKPFTGAVCVGDIVALKNNSRRPHGIGHIAIVYGGSKGVKRIAAGRWAALGTPLIIESRGRAEDTVLTDLPFWKQRRYYAGIRRLSNFKLADPTSTTPVPTAQLAAFRLLLWNVELTRWAKVPWAKRRSKIARRCREVLADGTADGASIIGLNEISKAEAADMASLLGEQYRAYHSGMLRAWIIDTSVWTVTSQTSANFGGDQVHGYLTLEVRHRATGRVANLVLVHLNHTSAKTRAKQLALVTAKTASWSDPTIICGDFNALPGEADKPMAAAGYSSLRTTAPTRIRDTYRTVGKFAPGGRVIDHIYTRDAVARGYRVLDGISYGSDHNALTGQISI